MGGSVTEGSIVEWRVKPGQWIDEGATLVDVTTDKVDVEVPAPASGVLTAVLANEGDNVRVGAVLAEIDRSAARPEGEPAPSTPKVAPPRPLQPPNTASAAPPAATGKPPVATAQARR